jgi:hypothetical protein
MIRRGFWVALGAAGGIMGYRRVASLGRRAPAARWARETIRFARDIREGMDLYPARHPGRPGPTLGGNRGPTPGADTAPGASTAGSRGAASPEPPGRVPDGNKRHRVGRADNDDEKDDR